MVANHAGAKDLACGMHKAAEKPKGVHTTLKYYGGDPSLPLEPTIIGGPEPPKWAPKVDSPVIITDVTDNEDQYKLMTHGFQYAKHKTQFESVLPELKNRNGCTEPLNETTKAHYDEMHTFLEDILSKQENLPKPSLIRILMHTNRVSQVGQKGTLGPIYNVHVDQSASAAEVLAHRWLGEDAAELLAKPRFQIINMWRPCKPITRDPFAVSDATTIPDSDYIKVPFVYPDRTSELLEVCPAANPERPHRWYFKDNQQTDDVVLFIQADTTKRPGAVRRCPHAAFKDPRLEESKEDPRVSIEIRAMVVYDHDNFDVE
ncbi:catalyzes late reaction in the cephamycin biosynthetic pathway [Colletotrichum truncatum]|uniref:Catalyzes late reaction in the cephamycin biosynthetic pathway n=1 Tax=Colletotrichum truncatum TaxID=5467 RepID=A0ACC3Z033_COLTU|nr:catalyzes late reaction in the cephamycin biosynthetic pathway [Colletotrichum truncatum]KAF6800822.1 catalyzes late reaction in the cephamycin biosynthetic pathway [Colletotrichum truncatum]